MRKPAPMVGQRGGFAGARLSPPGSADLCWVINPCTRGQRDFVVFNLMTHLSMGRSVELKWDLPKSAAHGCRFLAGSAPGACVW